MNTIDVSRRSLRKESLKLAVRSKILELHADLLLVDDRLPLLNALRETALAEYREQLVKLSGCEEFHGVATLEGGAAITLLDCIIDMRATCAHTIVQSCYRYSLPEMFSGDGQLALLMLEAVRLRCSKLKSNSQMSLRAIHDCRCILQKPWFSPYL